VTSAGKHVSRPVEKRAGSAGRNVGHLRVVVGDAEVSP
jgi:hypothetical protein